MQLSMALHVLSGVAGLGSGYVALYASKGAPAHRRSGMFFVSVMLTVAVTGFMISAVRGVAPELNMPTAAVTFYMVVTALTTVQPATPLKRRLDQAAMVMAFAIAGICGLVAISYIGKPGPASIAAYPLSIFGTVAALGGVGDLRVLRSGPLTGAPRLKRHLWRMCFGLFIASIAVFLPNRLPVELRIPALRIAGSLAPIAAIAYWMWRLHAVTRRPARVPAALRYYLRGPVESSPRS
jgi:uncharacterized membrane protein